MKAEKRGAGARREARQGAAHAGGGPVVEAASLGALLLFGALAIAASLAPMPVRFAPDLLFCVLAVWAVRRPNSTPALAVFALGLARDLLSGAPAGAGALGLLIAVEGLRVARPPRAGEGLRGWLPVWGVVGAWAAAPAVVPWALLTVTFAPAPAFADIALRYAATVVAFPLAAVALAWAAPVENSSPDARALIGGGA
ncbi:rod shape-determining protein MreD [Rubrimonas cliftonensis]|uniref:Rod shape-determining protein MreD n=1 Tax=Rubrimonas cliftonensis TaxID=89524 RepID=A0A1H3W2W1_9RHOB|nr:rod shape-determining protein MreD [Rubrimonas cliftonensis]SDZ81396.1 rod shape-determining protein MreD [Rubrimonas cliftonensis]